MSETDPGAFCERPCCPEPGSSAPPARDPSAAAEQHLGDRLAAFVDGELDHDSRGRVQAHLATCDDCRGEAESQRRLKSLFSVAAYPAPSPALLARLQGLAGGGRPDGPDGGLPDAGNLEVIFTRQGEPLDSPYLRPADPTSALPSGGFRIHEFTKGPRPAQHRGRRFAFAAAGALSMAAIALSGALPLDTADQLDRTEEPGTAATPLVYQKGVAPAAPAASAPSGNMLVPAVSALARLVPQATSLPPTASQLGPAPSAR